MQKNNDISVIFCQYNSDLDRIIISLRSVLVQQGCSIQVIVADDGSEKNYFEEIEKLFKDRGFDNYSLLASENNEGTVKNFIKGVLKSNGRYIKALSPGDCIYSKYALRDWIISIENSKKKWSFCDVVYYSNTNKSIIIDNANPKNVIPYLHNNNDRCRWNYVIFSDIALGASILCERSICLEYLKRIEGEIIYAEDNIYRIMMFDGIVASYFPSKAVLYEYGGGVSTSGNKEWLKKLMSDWQKADQIMKCGADIKDKFQLQLLAAMDIQSKKSIFERIKMPNILWKYLYRFESKFRKRKTCQIDSEVLEENDFLCK